MSKKRKIKYIAKKAMFVIVEWPDGTYEHYTNGLHGLYLKKTAGGWYEAVPYTEAEFGFAMEVCHDLGAEILTGQDIETFLDKVNPHRHDPLTLTPEGEAKLREDLDKWITFHDEHGEDMVAWAKFLNDKNDKEVA